MKAAVSVRPMQGGDIAAVLEIQRACYPDLMQESAAAFSAKLGLAPQGCWVAEEQGRLLGYLFSHPWTHARPPELDTPLAALPATADSYFIHDMAISPAAQGRGVAQRLFRAALDGAKRAGFRRSALVAVQGADGFWQRHGYLPVRRVAPRLSAKLAAGYGSSAVLMARPL